MKRTAKFLIAVAVLVLGVAGVALAAGSPQVTPGPASNITDTSAVLTATINPNGNSTDYVFDYGVTTAYGETTPNHSIGSGSKPVAVKVKVTGLTPGTTYHFRVVALNKGGAASGADRHFTTTGHPPAGVVTGPAVNIGNSAATVTGSVNPEGASTGWTVQYGTSTAYGFQTAPQVLAAVSTPLPVSAVLSGLAPRTLFHYRILAYHGGNVISTGADATFFTEPIRPPSPRLRSHTTPGTAAHRPYAFATKGHAGGATWIPATARCSGSVRLRYYVGHRRIGTVVTGLGPDCNFVANASFAHVPGSLPAPIVIHVHYNGNGYLGAADWTNRVTAG